MASGLNEDGDWYKWYEDTSERILPVLAGIHAWRGDGQSNRFGVLDSSRYGTYLNCDSASEILYPLTFPSNSDR